LSAAGRTGDGRNIRIAAAGNEDSTGSAALRDGKIWMPISSQIGELAIDAAMTYGKVVGHAADLNFGDCFAHA
jgi:uncharacterized protein with PIN domain